MGNPGLSMENRWMLVDPQAQNESTKRELTDPESSQGNKNETSISDEVSSYRNENMLSDFL